MDSEIDKERFLATAPFCAYLHVRPDGRIFYVGKGLRRRAYDFSPSRRSRHHQNIVAKYGRENIGVRVIPARSEQEALDLEVAHIASWRRLGHALANKTLGGEGCSGRKPTQAQLDALERGRGPGRLHGDALRRCLEGLARGRANNKWRASPAGKEHLRKLGRAGAKKLHATRAAECSWCGREFQTRSAKARCCGRACDQRKRRKAQKCRS